MRAPTAGAARQVEVRCRQVEVCVFEQQKETVRACETGLGQICKINGRAF